MLDLREIMLLRVLRFVFVFVKFACSIFFDEKVDVFGAVAQKMTNFKFLKSTVHEGSQDVAIQACTHKI
jgi:hypothetical protein